jgi:opacity protein-like surface antigen
MATGAQADDLTALKAQLEALQSRVNQLESTGPAASAGAPAGASYMTFNRGSDLNEMFVTNRLDDQLPGDRGFTIAITPTADLPAPIMEVAVSGYVQFLASYDTHSNTASSGGAAIVQGGGDDEHFQMDALRSRLRVTSKSDTAIGQIRTLIEGDFRRVNGPDQVFRLRHAWGEWDMTPNTVFGAGQYWATNYHGIGETPMVNWNGQWGTSGFNKSWVPQVQIRHTSGPFTFAVGLMNPWVELATGQDTQLPDLGARVTGTIGTASFGIGAVVREIHLDTDGAGAGVSDTTYGAGVSAGVDIPFGDMITLHATAGYGDGATDMTGGLNPGATLVGGNIETNESWGGAVGVSFKLSEASTINANYSITESEGDNLAGTAVETADGIAVNYIWQPVSKLRMGVEAYYRNDELANGADEDNLRLTFGSWFFF